jgi:hypothetical protein
VFVPSKAFSLVTCDYCNVIIIAGFLVLCSFKSTKLGFLLGDGYVEKAYHHEML